MKKYIYILLILLTASACSNEEGTLFSEKDSYMAFAGKAININEATINEAGSKEVNSIEIPINWATRSKETVELELEVISEHADITIPAVEGIDFTITSKTIKFENGATSSNVKITTIDNSSFTGTKKFIIKMKTTTANASLGSSGDGNDQIVISIIDDEHPLAAILGNYKMKYASLFGTNNTDAITMIADDEDTEIIYLNWNKFGVAIKWNVTKTESGFTLSAKLPQTVSTVAAGLVKYVIHKGGGSVIMVETEIILNAPSSGLEMIFQDLPFALILHKPDNTLGAYELPIPGTITIYR